VPKGAAFSIRGTTDGLERDLQGGRSRAIGCLVLGSRSLEEEIAIGWK
jgi:hypothetical protein